ncbi:MULTISPECIES: pepsin-like aspartyl protease [unclassified Shewanella]|uniref:pepsin-like aspartyl protease n=1 Tax=unclassified Shewanella TaxID=196818 RepID=UPI0035537D95
MSKQENPQAEQLDEASIAQEQALNQQAALKASNDDHHQHLLGHCHHHNQMQQHLDDTLNSCSSDGQASEVEQTETQAQEQLASLASLTPEAIKPRTVKLPLVNVYAKGGYCVQMHLGSEGRPANLIVDTGSSTLVVKKQVYRPHDDQLLQSGPFAQQVIYGAGGWDGPLVHTKVSVSQDGLKDDLLAQDSLDKNTTTHVPHLNLAHEPLDLEGCPVAIVPSLEHQKTFADADGILGLAYYGLNKSYDLTAYIEQHEIKPASTFPWPFLEPNSVCPAHSDHDAKSCDGADEQERFSGEDLKRFRKFLKKQPQQTVVPYFTRLNNSGLTNNRFAFHSKRSSIHIAKDDYTQEQIAADPLNKGWLILGGGKEHTELYQGKFKTIDVIHNRYYNVKLYSMSVGDQAPVAAPALQEKYIPSHKSNAIIDTGVSGILLTNLLYEAMLQGFSNVSEAFVELVTPFKDIRLQEEGIDMTELFKGGDMTGHHSNDLSHWPTLHFTFDGEITNECPDKENEVIDKAITISCKPEHYWQLNSPSPGKACFKILSQLPRWPNQCLLGTPLLNDYYVIFDRSAHETGVIRFAEQRD